MTKILRTTLFLGIVLLINAFIHYFVIKIYGMDIIDLIKKLTSTLIYEYATKFVKYEILFSFIILSISDIM